MLQQALRKVARVVGMLSATQQAVFHAPLIFNSSWFSHSDGRLCLTHWWHWTRVQEKTWSGGPNISALGTVEASRPCLRTPSWRQMSP